MQIDAALNENLLNFLNPASAEKIHKATVKVLGETGVLVEHEKMRDKLSARGAKVEDSGRVKFPPGLIKEAIDKAPEQFTLHARDPKNNLSIGKEGKTYAHNTGGPPNMIDFKTGERRPATIEDIQRSAKIVDALDNVHEYTPMVCPKNVNQESMELEMLYFSLDHTTKVIGSAVMSKHDVRYLHQIFQVLAGDAETLREKPMFDISPSSISPLYFDRSIIEAFQEAGKFNIPVTLLPTITSGATAPFTVAGSLVEQNSELLAGLVVLQTVNPQNPVVFGTRLAPINMETGSRVSGNPEIGMMSAAMAQLGQLYEIPTNTTGFSTASKVMDQQSGYERMTNALIPALSGSSFITGAGDLDSGLCADLSQLVLDNEILSFIFRIKESFEIGEEKLASNVIDSVGPKGSFLSHPHTASHCRNGEFMFPDLSERGSWEEWAERGEKQVNEYAKSKAKNILDNHEVEPIPADKKEEIDRIMDEARQFYASEVS
ncbi:MAG: trimethylamine methyltransferase family protein [Candidatus Bipolaricaulia bacterium]